MPPPPAPLLSFHTASARGATVVRYRPADARDVGLGRRVVDGQAAATGAVLGSAVAAGGEDALTLDRGLGEEEVLGLGDALAEERFAQAPADADDLGAVVVDDGAKGVEGAGVAVGALVDEDVGGGCLRQDDVDVEQDLDGAARGARAVVDGDPGDGARGPEAGGRRGDVVRRGSRTARRGRRSGPSRRQRGRGSGRRCRRWRALGADQADGSASAAAQPARGIGSASATWWRRGRRRARPVRRRPSGRGRCGRGGDPVARRPASSRRRSCRRRRPTGRLRPTGIDRRFGGIAPGREPEGAELGVDPSATVGSAPKRAARLAGGDEVAVHAASRGPTPGARGPAGLGVATRKGDVDGDRASRPRRGRRRRRRRAEGGTATPSPRRLRRWSPARRGHGAQRRQQHGTDEGQNPARAGDQVRLPLRAPHRDGSIGGGGPMIGQPGGHLARRRRERREAPAAAGASRRPCDRARLVDEVEHRAVELDAAHRAEERGRRR